MIKRVTTTLMFIFVFTANIVANDTLVISNGDTIHPIDETLIKIERENLSISYNNLKGCWDVEVDFIFNNPTDEVIKEKIAFVNESVPYKDYNYKIMGFTTLINGVKLPFHRKEEERKEELPDGITEYFISDIVFQPGFTKVYHTYSYFGILGTFRGFYYVLTSAKTWNGPIKYFSLEIELPKDVILFSYSGNINDPEQDINLIPYGQYKELEGDIFFKRGGFFATKTNYLPKKNLWVEIYHLIPYLYQNSVIKGKKISMYNLLYEEIKESAIANMKKRDLRILRNTIYAWHGFKFKDEELDKYYSKKLWYFPQESKEIQLTNIQEKNVKLILKQEKKMN